MEVSHGVTCERILQGVGRGPALLSTPSDTMREPVGLPDASPARLWYPGAPLEAATLRESATDWVEPSPDRITHPSASTVTREVDRGGI